MKQAGIHGSTAAHAQNRAGILEAEIKQDKGGPGDATAAKEEELAETKALADKATSSQMESLAKANEIMQDASEAKKDSDRKEEADKTSGEAEEQGRYDAADGAAPGISDDRLLQETNGEKEQPVGAQAPSEQEQRRNLYHPVDVRI